MLPGDQRLHGAANDCIRQSLQPTSGMESHMHGVRSAPYARFCHAVLKDRALGDYVF